MDFRESTACAECEHRATLIWLLVMLVALFSAVAVVSTTKWMALRKAAGGQR